MQPGRQGADCASPGTGRAAGIYTAAALAAVVVLAAAAAASQVIPDAHATPPCSVFDAEKVWRAYDDIYTGEVVSVERLGGGEGARVHFEVARTLKGDPQPDSWHVDMPARTHCPGDFCAEGADRHAPGTEVFRLGGFNGMYSPVSGACGVGSAEAGTRIGVPGMVFSYYRSLYGFAPPRDDPCRDPSHELVVRERGGVGGRTEAACVRPSTAERLGWEAFDREEWGASHAPPAPAYDLPIVRSVRADGWGGGAPFELSASRVPAVGQEAVITATYGGGGPEGGPGRGSPYAATVRLSPNLEFVGLEGVEEWRSYYPDGRGQLYSFEIPPGSAGEGHSFSATIRAASEGYAYVSYGGDYHSVRIEMHAGPSAGLLVDDYHRAASPLPDMSAFRDYGWAGKLGAWGPALRAK